MREIPLTQGKVALVDDWNYERLTIDSPFDDPIKWTAHWNNTEWYAIRCKHREIIRMHHLILKPRPGLEIDHINGNGLDNQEHNLREVTRSQNLMNRRANLNSTSQYIGVYFEQYTGRWCAAIKKDGITKKIGRFDSEEAAARARDIVAQEWFGEFARLNLGVENGT